MEFKMETNQNLAAEMKTTLRKFNKGVRDVKIEYGIFCVYVSSHRSLIGVMTDMLRTRAFRSVVPVVNNIDGGFIVNAVPA
jgi:hypothetical protein